MRLGLREIAAGITLMTGCNGVEQAKSDTAEQPRAAKQIKSVQAEQPPAAEKAIAYEIDGCRARARRVLQNTQNFTASTGTFMGSWDSAPGKEFQDCLRKHGLPRDTSLIPFPPLAEQ